MNDIAGNQFGFKKGCSTTDIIERINAIADRAAEGQVKNRDIGVLVMLDIRSAFNSTMALY